MNVIEVKNLTKYYGKKKAVDSASFEVEKGEIYGFLGPNGAGKTTTIRCMMDFIRPTKGSISLFGMDSYKNSVALKNRIGYLSGDVRLYDKWTGEEHFSFIQKARGKASLLKKMIKDLDFDPKVRSRNLSSGNKQKLGIIMAFMNEPELLILDEPTSALDPLLQNIVYDYLMYFKKKGKTVFMSSHNLSEVERVCSRAGIIKKGSIISTENIKDLKFKKMHVITVSFDGDFDKNIFKFDGIEVAKEIPEGLILHIKGDINIVVNMLSKYKLKDLEINRATLEDIFLEFYEK